MSKTPPSHVSGKLRDTVLGAKELIEPFNAPHWHLNGEWCVHSVFECICILSLMHAEYAPAHPRYKSSGPGHQTFRPWDGDSYLLQNRATDQWAKHHCRWWCRWTSLEMCPLTMWRSLWWQHMIVSCAMKKRWFWCEIQTFTDISINHDLKSHDNFGSVVPKQ